MPIVLPIDENLKSELLLLWRREMVVGSYIPRWITATIDGRQIDILAFTVNLEHSVYVNPSKSEIVESLATAKGGIRFVSRILEFYRRRFVS